MSTYRRSSWTAGIGYCALLVLPACSEPEAPSTASNGTSGAAGGVKHADSGPSAGSGGSSNSTIIAPDATAVQDVANGGGMVDALPEIKSDGTVSCAGAIVCDDFEANSVGAAPAMWGVDIGPTGSGTVKVDTTRAFSGTKSLRITVMPQMDHDRAFITHPLSGLPNNTFFGRMMMWVVATPPGNVHWDNIRGQGIIPGGNVQAQCNYGGGSNTGNMMGNYYTTSSDCWKTSKSKLPTGKWSCVEWEYNGMNDEMHYWLESQEVADLAVLQKGDGCTGPNLWKAPTYEKVSLGWYNAQASPVPIEMWLDDVAIDIKRIGCPPAH